MMLLIKKGVMKKFFFVLALCASAVLVFKIRSYQADNIQKADLVIFSFDRPLQLYALLESEERYFKGILEKHVIYRSSNEQYEQGYEIVKEKFEKVVFHQQGSNPHVDFKPLTLKAAFESPAPYILFAVDDIVVKEATDITECIKVLENYDAYAFYLRLGKNLTACYSMQRNQPQPVFTEEEPDLFSWHFNKGYLDWCYPHTVDMTIYRKKDIEGSLRILSYHIPNRLEAGWMWRSQTRNIIGKKGLCYAASKIVNLPLNRVQHDYPMNPVMTEFSPKDLLDQFLAGNKMDIDLLYKVENRSAHMEHSPTFISR